MILKIKFWIFLKKIVDYTVSHMLGKAIAAFSSLLLVRILPVNEYGIYTLLLGAFLFICTFSDMGATETLTFFRWRAGKKGVSWMPYYYAILRLRKIIFVIGFFAVSIYIYLMAAKLKSNFQTVAVGITLVGINAWVTIHSSIISYVLKLKLKFRAAYAIELSNEAAKLIFVFVLLLINIDTAISGMVCITGGSLLALYVAKKVSATEIEINPAERNFYKLRKINRILIGQILPTLPGSIHFALQGILGVWLAAYFGQVSNVAEVGALGRLGVLISVIAGFTGTVFVPQLVSIKDEKIFLKRYLQWWCVILFLGFTILLLVATFSSKILFLIGSKYSGLDNELLIISATAVIGTWGGYAWSISRARGWIRYHMYSVPLTIGIQILMCYVLDLSNTRGIMLFGFFTLSVGLFYQLITNIVGLMGFYKK